MADDFASFNRKLDDFRSELDGTKLKAKLDQIGKAAKDDAAKAVQADLGDQSASNWWRGRPIKIEARYDLKGDHEIEDGRRGGSATDLVLVGRVRKSGTRRAKSRGRNQGATAGKNTWSEAVEIMERETPKRVDRYVVQAAIRKSGV
jgi:hypothetical protein